MGRSARGAPGGPLGLLQHLRVGPASLLPRSPGPGDHPDRRGRPARDPRPDGLDLPHERPRFQRARGALRQAGGRVPDRGARGFLDVRLGGRSGGRLPPPSGGAAARASRRSHRGGESRRVRVHLPAGGDPAREGGAALPAGRRDAVVRIERLQPGPRAVRCGAAEEPGLDRRRPRGPARQPRLRIRRGGDRDDAAARGRRRGGCRGAGDERRTGEERGQPGGHGGTGEGGGKRSDLCLAVRARSAR